MKKIVDELSKDIRKTEPPNMALLKLIESIEKEHKRYENSKKPPSFLRV